MPLGLSTEHFDQAAAGSGFGSVIRLSKDVKIGEALRFRLVAGAAKCHAVWLPVMRLKTSTQSYEPSWACFHTDEKNTFFGPLADADKMIQLKHLPRDSDKTKVRSMFDCSPTWKYWILPRSWKEYNPEKPEVYRMEAGWKVQNGIYGIRETTVEGNDGLLEYGPLWSFDLVVKVVEKAGVVPGMPEYMRRDYNVLTDSIMPLAKKAPRSWINEPPPDMDVVAGGFFTAAEWEVVGAFNVDLNEEKRPYTVDEIRLMLEETPLDINGARNGQPIFPHREALAEVLTKFDLPAMDMPRQIGPARTMVGSTATPGSQNVGSATTSASEQSFGQPKPIPGKAVAW